MFKLNKILQNQPFTFISLSYFSDLYSLLGVNPASSFAEIREAYLEKVKLYHPDKNQHSEEHFKQIQNAYEILKNVEKRENYDNSINFPSQKPSQSENSATYSEDYYKVYSQYKAHKNEEKAYNFSDYEDFFRKKKRKIYEEDFFLNKIFLFSFLGFALFFSLFEHKFPSKNTAAFDVKQEAFYKESANLSPEFGNFKNFTGVASNRRIPSDSEAIRMELLQKELNDKKIKIEIGSCEIYNPRRNSADPKKKAVLESSGKGIYKSKDKDAEKGRILTVSEYRERFSAG